MKEKKDANKYRKKNTHIFLNLSIAISSTTGREVVLEVIIEDVVYGAIGVRKLMLLALVVCGGACDVDNLATQHRPAADLTPIRVEFG
jgi:hypothetical protein